MGLFDALFGRTRPVQPKPEGIYELPSAAVSLEVLFDLKPEGRAGVCFKPIPTHHFREVEEEMREMLTCASDEGTSFHTHMDALGYQWVLLEGGGVESLVTALASVVDALEDAGYADKLVCALFPFRDGKRAYLVYNYKRGTFYPFVPSGSHERDAEMELKIASLMRDELTLERDESRWYPIWDAPI
ncbi:PspA-associated protein PspAB [Methermicoccus shengliensis]|uniref:Uncharacterized protein n=1 Tax=Methermicoccus shengliensis TaxID=660064 RepID=A0A832RXF7_9EURY|nr:hypothetical protein [Methermicoccus shengliensis]KUK04758.1 MAG: hypothetical protein XD46_0459 [Euryarchaeota archaeon 55_53]KUK29918.1 MAG: hypothetical protein XD62_0985 [Methanosarcinales archeaon 56_1174]MDI3487675.1 hypothetical protein [Methanosarcinales archaeon]MDN5295561.1 hypothetical protein [Methanosarcinales archaeon]HIH70320.1 hypothetical protein [Methermicoccus shengliensis]